MLYIQSYRRMLPVRRAFLEVRAAAVTIQAASRGRVARREYIQMRTRHRAALRVQVWPSHASRSRHDCIIDQHACLGAMLA